MTKHYDVIVAGAGAMGSAALYQLASRGLRVLALDRFEVPHQQGSSHGLSRIIRLAYFEHPSYVPLLKRSYELWRSLEQEANTRLLHITGSIDAGTIFEDAQRSAQLHSLPHEVLTSAELSRRFPAYRLPAETMALFQPEGGFLIPEACISTNIQLAQAKGAHFHPNEPLLDWHENPGSLTIRTLKTTYQVQHLVLATGAWVSKLLPEITHLAVPERQVVTWLKTRTPAWFQPENFPVFNLRLEKEGHFYGFPEHGAPGFKFGRYHHRHEVVDPDLMSREANSEDESLLRNFAEKYFPQGAGPTLSLQTCLFTNTPDEHFILDFHPRSPRVVIASPCSGHGFKFSSVVGEILADLVQHGTTQHDISMHSLSRFARF